MTKRERCSRRLLLRSVIYSTGGGWVCQYPLLTVLSSWKYCGPHQHISQPPPSVVPTTAIKHGYKSFTPTRSTNKISTIVFFEVPRTAGLNMEIFHLWYSHLVLLQCYFFCVFFSGVYAYVKIGDLNYYLAHYKL